MLLDVLSSVYAFLIRPFLLVDPSCGEVVDELIAEFTRP